MSGRRGHRSEGGCLRSGGGAVWGPRGRPALVASLPAARALRGDAHRRAAALPTSDGGGFLLGFFWNFQTFSL